MLRRVTHKPRLAWFSGPKRVIYSSLKPLYMAEIHVEPKKKSTAVWPWILLILAVAILAYFLTRNNDDANLQQQNTTTTGQVMEVENPVSLGLRA